MAPKLPGARTRKQKSSDSKAAGKILKASQEAVNLQEKKKSLKEQMAKIQEKEQERRARTLKNKKSSTQSGVDNGSMCISAPVCLWMTVRFQVFSSLIMM